jgi:hypothetical protein
MAAGASLKLIFQRQVSLRLGPGGQIFYRPATRIGQEDRAVLVKDRTTLIAVVHKATELATLSTSRPVARIVRRKPTAKRLLQEPSQHIAPRAEFRRITYQDQRKKRPPMKGDGLADNALLAFYQSRLHRWGADYTDEEIDPADEHVRVNEMMHAIANILGRDVESVTYQRKDPVRAAIRAYNETLQLYFFGLRPAERPDANCAGCQRALGDSPIMEVLNGIAVHDVAESECVALYGKRWQRLSGDEVAKFGIYPPTAYEHEYPPEGYWHRRPRQEHFDYFTEDYPHD